SASKELISRWMRGPSPRRRGFGPAGGSSPRMTSGDSKPALADLDGVTGAHGSAERHHVSRNTIGIGVRERDEVALGARREPAGNRDGAFDRHVGHVRVLAGRLHLAEN